MVSRERFIVSPSEWAVDCTICTYFTYEGTEEDAIESGTRHDCDRDGHRKYTPEEQGRG